MIRRTALSLLAGAAILPLSALAQAPTPADPAQIAGLALAAGAFTLQSSEIALARATRPDAKTFAGFEIVEQRSILEAMRAGGVDTPAVIALDAQRSQVLGQLRSLDGAEFDRGYVAAQAAGHNDLLQLHQALARVAPDPTQRALSTLATATIQQHLAMLQEMGG